jgi:hypothetical protein
VDFAVSVRVVVPITILLAIGCKTAPQEGDWDFGDEPASTGPEEDDDDDDPADDDDADDEETTGDDAGETDGEEPEDAPHALGTIVIGESHDPETLTMQASVVASFVPDEIDAAPRCGTEIDGCFVQSIPDCGELGCEVGESCVWGDACQSVCQVPCDLACAADEVCYFPVPDVPGCKKLETFDAGTLSFLGTTVAVTLYPPYVLPAGFEGPLAIPDQEITVMASAAAGAGFEAFEVSVGATRTMSSSAGQMSLADAFGEEDLRIAWAPGDDKVVVTLTVAGELGGYGTVRCEAEDPGGELMVPRAAISTAGGGAATSIGVAVERQRTAVTMGVMTRGALLDAEVQPTGWVELISSSVETATVIGCSSGYTPCGETCVNLDSDEYNCGECDNVCPTGYYCSLGACY